MKPFVVVVLALVVTFLAQAVHSPCKPMQVHTALSDAYTSDATPESSPLKIIFHTSEECSDAYIIVTTSDGNTVPLKATSVEQFSATYYNVPYLTFVHIFDLSPLAFERNYTYTCYGHADNSHPTGPFPFYLSSPTYTNKPTTVIMYGDMNYSNYTFTMVNRLTKLTQDNFTNIAAVIHYGDLAYNLENQSGKRGNDFMNGIQPIAATLPYMIVPGNHEVRFNFSNVNMRFRMPNYDNTNNHLFSYNIGNIHFVHFSIDLISLHPELLSVTTDFLKKDLAEANQNRGNRPWIIVTSHRPIWTATMPPYNYPFDPKKNPKDCIPECELPPNIFPTIEKILYDNRIDIYVGGHIHHYERLRPVYNGKTMHYTPKEGDKHHNYITDAQAPVHILQGTPIAGKYEDDLTYLYENITIAWGHASSFAAIHAINNTHLHFENILSATGKPNDFMYLIKNQPVVIEKIEL